MKKKMLTVIVAIVLAFMIYIAYFYEPKAVDEENQQGTLQNENNKTNETAIAIDFEDFEIPFLYKDEIAHLREDLRDLSVSSDTYTFLPDLSMYTDAGISFYIEGHKHHYKIFFSLITKRFEYERVNDLSGANEERKESYIKHHRYPDDLWIRAMLPKEISIELKEELEGSIALMYSQVADWLGPDRMWDVSTSMIDDYEYSADATRLGMRIKLDEDKYDLVVVKIGNDFFTREYKEGFYLFETISEIEVFEANEGGSSE